MSSPDWPETAADYQTAMLGYEVTMVAVGRAIVRMQRAGCAAQAIADRQADLEELRQQHDELRARSRA